MSSKRHQNKPMNLFYAINRLTPSGTDINNLKVSLLDSSSGDHLVDEEIQSTTQVV
ncbi:MAG: hypothetical protein H7A33_02260 [Deltaproteobacteria bacterium]|nr:hypothetical protein [Deltaproteobacteria bacterium]